MTTRGGGFQQLYYTSCEHGLSGFSGFQFNAVSAGTSAETMHIVEALAGYDPPHTLAESDTPHQLAQCPVNLCFVPSDGRATALCVRYVGRDSARRFGNYFAHALHSEDFTAAGGGALGIELWRSAVWRAEVARGTEIPTLGGALPTGPLDHRSVRAFLHDHPHLHQLEHLLAAVFTALAEERSVVVVDDTADRIAHWFATVSYLLPPPLARQLSFTTYQFRPSRSRLHLIGTVPGAKLDIGPDDQDAYTVFDFTAGRFPTDLPVHHLVHLLARIGIGAISAVWSWTADYADGSERQLGDWHAPVAAAAAAGGIPLTPADVTAVSHWIAAAEHLGPRRAVVARDIYLKHRTLDHDQLAALSAAALIGGDRALHDELEGKLYDSRMRSYLTDPDNATEPVPITDPTVRRNATELWQTLLDGTEGARQQIRLLLWARKAGLTPATDTVARVCRELTDTLLSSTALLGAKPALARETEQLLLLQPTFREAVVAGVADLVATRGGHHQLFAQFPAHLLKERDLADNPELLEHYWLTQRERDPQGNVELMFRILAVRRQAFPDAALLRCLWRHQPWTHREAIEIARTLPAGAPEDGALGEWLDRAVRADIDSEAELDDCLRLCALLTAPAKARWLRPAAKETVATTRELDSLLRSTQEATLLARHFTSESAQLMAPARALKRFRLVDTLLRLPADPSALPTTVERLGFRTADSYLRAVHTAVVRGGRVSEVLLSHVAGLALIDPRSRLQETHLHLVSAIQRHTADRWRVEDTERLAQRLRPHDPVCADAYLSSAQRRLSTSRKLVRRLSRRGPTDLDPPAGPGGKGGERDGGSRGETP